MVYINKALAQNELEAFLKSQFPDREIYLAYETKTDWDKVEQNMLLFEYESDKDVDTGFRFYLDFDSIPRGQDCTTLERLSYELSQHFDCATACDASRLELSDRPYCSLLFEKGHVYLGNDGDYGEDGNGEIYKWVALFYDWPDYPVAALTNGQSTMTFVIRLNRALEHNSIHAFLTLQWPEHKHMLTIDSISDPTVDGDFSHTLVLHFNRVHQALDPLQRTVEKLSAEISRYFDCITICEASRLYPKSSNFGYFKLLFENHRVYWVTDDEVEDTGCIQRFIELKYDLPDYFTDYTLAYEEMEM